MSSRSIVRFSLVALLAVIVAAAVGGAWSYGWLNLPLQLESPLVVIVPEGKPLARVAGELAGSGVLDHPRVFTWYARLTGAARRVHAGEYTLTPGLTAHGLLERFVRGAVVQHDVTILEGWTVAQLLKALRAEAALEHRIPPEPDALVSMLELPRPNAEGLFFPDTYRFTRGDTDLEVLRRAHERMSAVLETAWSARDADLPYADEYEALILASIIEKETGREEERTKVARVFVSRLQQGMALQTDPTVIYGLGDGFDGNLTRRHLGAESPYNTYRRRGLPPTPIALPGQASIEAALHPAEGDYLYFVARGDGSSEFSATLDEHVRAVRRFQLGDRR